jgi:uncharacterized membrane protein HdeD (DUF308 family)
MLTALARNWWMVALRGVAAILFGIVAIVWPGLTVGVLVAFFGAFAIVDGSFSVAASLGGTQSYRWWYLLGGIASIAIGVIAWAWPDLTALTLLYIIASWAVIVGTFEIAAAVVLNEWLTEEWLLILSGAISILFGIVLFAFPGEGAIALVTTIGIFSIFLGGSLIGTALRLRGLNEGSASRGTGMGRAAGI